MILVGAFGFVGGASGVTGGDVAGLDAADVPTELVAVTVKVYDVPLINPVTVMGLDVPVPTYPTGAAGLGITRYESTEAFVGAVKEMVAEPLLLVRATAVTEVGAFGATSGATGVTVIGGLLDEDTEVPTELVAVMVRV